MKKFIAVLICMLLLTSCFIACNKDDDVENTDSQEVSDTVTDNSGETGDEGGDTSDTDASKDTEEEGIGEAGNNNADGNWTKPY